MLNEPLLIYIIQAVRYEQAQVHASIRDGTLSLTATDAWLVASFVHLRVLSGLIELPLLLVT